MLSALASLGIEAYLVADQLERPQRRGVANTEVPACSTGSSGMASFGMLYRLEWAVVDASPFTPEAQPCAWPPSTNLDLQVAGTETAQGD